MDNETFELVITVYRDIPRKYKVNVEIIHHSEQVIRFRIFGGGKSMKMEKLLLKNEGQWKILSTNFEFGDSPKDIAQTIMRIQDEIDFCLAGRPKPVNKYKDK